MWSTYLGCYQEHPSGFQMLGRVLRVTAFTLDKWNVCIQETKQILHSSLTIAVSMTQQLRSCRVHSGQATGSSADEPQTHTTQGAGCRNRTFWWLKAREQCLCPSWACSPVCVSWILSVAVLMPHIWLQQQTCASSSLHHKAKKEWEWQFSLVLLVFPIPLSYAFQHCPCSLSCLHLAAVVCTHPSLFSSLPWQLAFLFIDSPIFFLDNFELHIVRLLRLHVFCLPQLTCLCSPAASHSSADLAFTVHFLVYSASPSLT